MEAVKPCRCCLLRPPDKDLKIPYTVLGKTEIYSEMMKECFEIHLIMEANLMDADGICEACITRLRDACDFKHQVQLCQQEILEKVGIKLKSDQVIKDETPPKVKEEISDGEDNNDMYLLGEVTELKEELSDFEDDRNLAEVLGLNNVSLKKKQTQKRRGRLAVLQHDKMKISLRALSQINILKPVKVSSRLKQRVSENFKHKHNVENILKYSNCTPFANKTLCGVICAYCKQTFPLPQELRTHTIENHKNEEILDKRMDKSNLAVKIDITELQCTVCNTKCDNISILKKHLTEEHNVNLYPERFDYILEFKLSADQILDCALCHSRFETFKMCLQHMNGHYRNFICEVCDMGFINKHRLKNHQRTHELGTFKCSFCEKIFSTRVSMMCHEKYTHNTAARYKTNCPHCSETFTSYYQRNRHMNKEHNIAAATYKCNICDKSFILKSKLTSHIKKVHLMERNHTCPECGQGFFIKQSLDEHMIKHRGERVFKCTVCHKAYARKKTLIEHMRIHNNDRRFKCGVCELAFVQKCSLKSHMLSNHGITLSEYENARNELCNSQVKTS